MMATPNPDETAATPSWFMPQGPREGVGHYVEVLREHVMLIGTCIVAALAIAAIYAKTASPSYKAESRLLVTPVNPESNLLGLGLITSTGNPTGDVSTAASLVTTPTVADMAAEMVGRTTPNAILEAVSAVPVAESNVIAVTASASSPRRAAAIANAFSRATIETRTQALHSELESIIPVLKRELESSPSAARSGQGSLGERLSTLQALRASRDPTLSIAAVAKAPTSPSWPKTKLTLIAGILIGLIIGVSAAFLMEGLDQRVRREETLRRIFRLPVLARVPRERSRSAHGGPLLPDQLSAVGIESYRMLRVALGARNIRPNGSAQRSPQAIMVTGSTSSEGKSTIALNLASALATKRRRVVLIEADLRRPSLAASLGIRPMHGVASVLMTELPLEEALVPVEGTDGDLSILAVEHANPVLADGLLSNGGELVELAKGLADYVVVDAPPVTEISDALPLSRFVDDVLLVARLGHSRADQLVKLGEILARQGVRPSGLVIVGEEFQHLSGYYAEPSGGGRRERLGGLRKRIPATSP